MKVLLRYGSDKKVNPQIIEDIKNISTKYGDYEEEKWFSKGGVILDFNHLCNISKLI
jgi:hypothetical protein